MKIGILTYQRAENYGALLQAYAMISYLKSLGHDVSFVDYWPKYHSEYFKLFSWSRFLRASIKGKIVMLSRLFSMNSFLARKRKLQQFMIERLDLPIQPAYTEKSSFTEKYDTVVYGSDQIWRKQNPGGGGFDRWYFGADIICTDKRIVYAGSMGSISNRQEDGMYMKEQMTNFSSISVREKDLHDFLGQLGITSCMVMDPVFLLERDQWRKLFKRTDYIKKYILFYNLLNSSESINFANRLSKDTGLPIIEISKSTTLHRPNTHLVKDASLERFLQLIDGAEYVVSSSFHGVAMSIIFEKQFFAVGMGAKSNRVVSLLEAAGIKERYIESSPNQISLSQIDYDMVRIRIQDDIKKSKGYLCKALS